MPIRSWPLTCARVLSVKLAEITPGDIDAFFFTNGGAEANENAIRIARMFTGRHKIGARYRSYHGGTAGALTLTGDPRRWAAEPGIPGVFRIPDFYHGIQRGSTLLKKCWLAPKRCSNWKDRRPSRRLSSSRLWGPTAFLCRRTDTCKACELLRQIWDPADCRRSDGRLWPHRRVVLS